jgi:hypothetical protein
VRVLARETSEPATTTPTTETRTATTAEPTGTTTAPPTTAGTTNAPGTPVRERSGFTLPPLAGVVALLAALVAFVALARRRTER